MSKKIDKILEKGFFNTYKFSNKFILLRKGAYPYKYINDQENFNETPLLGKEDFYSHLKIEDITDAN